MRLQESGEMYLEAILILTQRGGGVRAIDVGEFMGFSKPSVSRAVGILKSGGFIEVDKDGYITLTEQGQEMAGKTYERHRLLTDVFLSLGVDGKVAAEDACKIEHVISDETFTAIKEFFHSHRHPC